METRQHGAFHEILKYQREVRGWSQARMAEELGTTPNRISAWERNISFPSAYFREKLCSQLDMDAQELGLLTASTPTIGTPEGTEDTPATNITLQAPETSISVQAPENPAALQSVTRHPQTKRTWLLAASTCTLLVIASIIIAYTTGFISFGAPNPYVAHTGQLVLDDSLRQPDANLNWQEGANESQASCLFKNGEYVAFQPNTGYFHACLAQKTDYKNFAYEVDMTIHQGDFGGIVFRSENSIDGQYYLFRIHTNGDYKLYRFNGHDIEHATLLDQGISQNFHSGLNQHNLLAVVAQNNTLALYVNRQQITALEDQGYNHGGIGVLAGSMSTGPGEAAFKDARVWTW
ncbi:hypothetical protein KDA_17460 [Dictyobacter alpinus]|uniref:HTH cro/C1-type domain-containing protein n=1 Tax=Dictyobacter alpinus TaxID=2014873 RepID=A0A402B4J4_9CHLR|nr:helix-turn-helix transcriptional regulator [Dictyobacter alpinus]GCE26262.1 hypothetical protein KDA_17460 [Dictyobacter alpinus]